MTWTKAIWKRLESNEAQRRLHDAKHGLERECLRVTQDGTLSETPHPRAYGSKLTHPWITTDFAEVQLELVTPPLASERSALLWLKRLHRHVYSQLQNEWIWPASTPCRLPDVDKIQLADYGSSESGLYKTLYRSGLSHRYGKKMQMLSGVHYNFSWSDSLWDYLRQEMAPDQELQHFRSEGYLHLIRNFLRWSWLNTYLFGATPVVDDSYFDDQPSVLEPFGHSGLHHPYACSLRMSEFGYYSKVQTQISVSNDSLEEYLRDLRYAISTPHPRWSDIPTQEQINDHILQIEAEHYARIRPKPKGGHNGGVLERLAEGGIEYIEARAVDIDPFEPDGICLDQLNFLHTFMLYCLVQESPGLGEEEQREVTANQNQVALCGRDPKLTLRENERERPLKAWAEELLQDMEPVAALMDHVYPGGRYIESLALQRKKLADPERLPSARVLAAVKREGGPNRFFLKLAKKHHQEVVNRRESSTTEQRFHDIAAQSVLDQEEVERREDFVLKGYERLELSSQMVIREALKRGVNVEVLDWGDSFLRLSKGSHVEYVKYATLTRHEPLISYFLMENKEVSKQLLLEAGIRAPLGYHCQSRSEALKQYANWKQRKLVVKPKHTNFGDGITVVEALDSDGFLRAIDYALTFGTDVLVEEFIPGDEYRFLVIDGKVEAVCQRLPAHVVGDGEHNVRQLVRAKNGDSRNYKLWKYRIRTGKVEREVLAEQGLTPDSVPAKGETVYLRNVSNVSTGGDPIDRTDDVHPAWNTIAVRATEVMGAMFCGLDLMTEDPTKPPSDDNYAIIEVNFNPALFLHRYPVQGKKRYVERAVLDVLGFREPAPAALR